jgi:hypothetical protein
MPVANITVAFVNPPKTPGSKKGSIKGEDGVYYGVWADKLYQFQKGGRYSIEYDTETDSQNRQWNTVKRVITNGTGQSPLPGQAAATRPGTTHGQPARAEEMFVMGLMNRSYQGTGIVPLEDVAYEQILGLRAAWNRAMNAPLGPTSRPQPIQPDEASDEIPF